MIWLTNQVLSWLPPPQGEGIKIQNVLPLHEDPKFCLKCPTETAAYSATEINSLGHLPTDVQTGILDTCVA
eukprot:COSAG01_NODE_65_length_29252_cov_173.296995_3_plen_71_part_00